MIKVFVIGAVVVVVAFVALVASHGGGGGSGGSGSSMEAQLIGLTRAQVVEKLGAPDRETAKELDYDQPYPDSTDKQVLRVYLDGDGRVKATTTDTPETGVP